MSTRITSPQNVRVKSAVRLRDRRGRDEQCRIVIDGAREIARACQAGVRVCELFAGESQRTAADEEVMQVVEQSGGDVFELPSNIMRKLAYGDRDSGLVAVAEPPFRSLDQLEKSVPAEAVVAVLEGVEKPGNVGAVVRTADATGVSAVLVADPGTDIFNPNAIRASAGTVFSLPVIAATADEVLNWLRRQQFRILTARVGAARNYWVADYSGRVAIVLGSEVAGLSDCWSGERVEPISLPQRGIADSLNVSVTAAVLFYEALRQREHSTPPCAD